MTDDALRTLAAKAGFAPRWFDNSGAQRDVAPDVLGAALAALGLPAHSPEDIADSLARLESERAHPRLPTLVAASIGDPIPLPAARIGARARLEFELGGAREFRVADAGEGRAQIPALDRIGYHRLLIDGREITLALAPRSALTIADIGEGRRLWGLAAQIYGLRRAGDGGIGDFAAVADLAEQAAKRGADMLALSPNHALYGADPHHFAPYSPSSRLFSNVLHAEPSLVLGEELCAPIAARFADDFARCEAADLIDWPSAASTRQRYFRALFDDFATRDFDADFLRFRADGGLALERHAIFEALHAHELARDGARWNWRDWAPGHREASSADVARFAQENADAVAFGVFQQWLADRSMAVAQGRAKNAGMRIGLVSDLAIGMNASGSHAWSQPDDLLLGLSIGAPPDALAPRGQNWGLSTFSPRALAAKGYAPFLATLRAALRNAGGVRIDHIMGVARLWLTPDGAEATDGVYLSYPTDDLLALLRLESARHGAIVIGEDLGTVPYGLREKLADSGIAGLRVLQFERDSDRFHAPHWYAPTAVAMTATHDTATFAGWWRGVDIVTRDAIGQLAIGETRETAEGARAHDREIMWNAFAEAGATWGAERPAPENPAPALDAAVRFIAKTESKLVVLPLEDALGLEPQPNLPGTTDEHPNWRRRYPGDSRAILDAPEVEARLGELAGRG